MTDLTSIDAIERLYAMRGGAHYGEGVTQIDHALQCAALAEADGAAPNLIVAALLHDIGHLVEDEAGVVAASHDHRHEALGAALLRPLFGPAVRAPIALHVAAKRYLCGVDPDYHAALSAASQASLVLQGGAFGVEEIAAFERRPYWRDAVALRRYDDTGKAEQAMTRAFGDYRAMMRALIENDTAMSTD